MMALLSCFASSELSFTSFNRDKIAPNTITRSTISQLNMYEIENADNISIKYI